MFVLSSDSSDVIERIPLGNGGEKGTPPARRANHAAGAPLSDSEEPDWVRNFTPVKRSVHEVAELYKDSDNDSFIDLVPDVDEEAAAAKPMDPVAKRGAKTARRARVGAKPKSSMPLVTAPKLDEGLVLLQGGEGALDLSGDVGAVGRVKVEDGALYLDIKGVLYRAGAHRCNTMCVVAVGEDEARVVAVLDEAVVLRGERNMFASNEMVLNGELVEDDGVEDHGGNGSGDYEAEDKAPDGGRAKKNKNANADAPKSKAKTKAKGKAGAKGKGKAAAAKGRTGVSKAKSSKGAK